MSSLIDTSKKLSEGGHLGSILGGFRGIDERGFERIALLEGVSRMPSIAETWISRLDRREAGKAKVFGPNGPTHENARPDEEEHLELETC